MRKFIYNSIGFLLILLAVSLVIPVYLLYTGRYMETVAGSEIYFSLAKSTKKSKAKKVLLGDSVGNQIFTNTLYNEGLNSLACNKAIGMVGHYILLRNYLEAGNKADTVFLMFSPFSFSNNINDLFTYHYFLKPFYKDKYKDLFTKTVNIQIEKIPFKDFINVPYILTSNWGPGYLEKDAKDYEFLSPVTIEYLRKIRELSYKYKFKLVMIAAPVSEANRAAIEQLPQSEIFRNGLADIFFDYFPRILYLSDQQFLDGIHLEEPQKFRKYYEQNYMSEGFSIR